jgi:hypothetical protein
MIVTYSFVSISVLKKSGNAVRSAVLPFSLLLACAGLSARVCAPAMSGASGFSASQWVNSGQEEEAGRDLLKCDRAGGSGQFTGERKPLGDVTCMMARVDLESMGCHPRAVGQNGAPAQGGGFFCAPNKTHKSGAPAAARV